MMDISSLIPAGLTNQLDPGSIPAGYNKLSENLRKFTPLAIQCAIFCGSRCKYENSKAWPPVHMAIKDIFSHWVTDDILAMARPNTRQILKNHIIAQFQAWSIKTLINLQTPGEHSSCGPPLEKSGFTYNPNDFMKNGIYCYNFAWKDYGGATMEKLLDMVKVVAFSVLEGKLAIHCHAGLGRTGVLIACYLIYSLRVRASDAIRFVRMKRPSAIQTRGQILCIKEFEHFVLPQMIVFPKSSNISNQRYCLKFYLKRQYNVLHGYEQRTFKQIPKIIFVICERILQLCDCREDNSPSEIDYSISYTPFTQRFISHVLEKLRQKDDKIKHSYSWTESITDLSFDDLTSSKNDTNFNASASSRETLNNISEDIFCASPDVPSCSSVSTGLDDNCIDDELSDGIREQELFDNNCYKEIQTHMNLKNAAQIQVFTPISADEAIKSLICNIENLSDEKKRKIHDYQIDLNIRSTAWQRLELETDLQILSSLLYEWLESLRKPILDIDALSQIVIQSSKPRQCLQKLDPCTRYVIEYLLRFVSRLRPLSGQSQNSLVKRLTAAITQQKVCIDNSIHPTGKNFQNLRSGTAGKLREFFVRLLNLIEEINTKDMNTTWPTSKWEICKLLHEGNVMTMPHL